MEECVVENEFLENGGQIGAKYSMVIYLDTEGEWYPN